MADMDGERWARSLFFVVLSGCLIAATISICILLEKLGGSAEAFVELGRSRAMREEMTGDLILESAVWMAANVMEQTELATAEERKEITNAVIEKIGQHNKNLGRVMLILDREAQRSDFFKEFVEDVKEGVESSDEIKDLFLDGDPGECEEPDESEEVEDPSKDIAPDEGVEEGNSSSGDAGGGERPDPFAAGGGDPFGGKDADLPDESVEPDDSESGAEQALPDDPE